MKNDTIAALSTDTRGAISIIRISGSDSLNYLKRIFFPFPDKFIAKKIYHGFIKKDHKKIDEVIVHFSRSPNSYNGEDIVEINCHGGISGRIILKYLIDLGVRFAKKGEFTLRAFLNGKIDLIQAEAVNMCINAKTEKGLQASMNNLTGKLTNEILDIRKYLINVLSHIEALLDFPEDEVENINKDEIKNYLKKINNKLLLLVDKHEKAKIIQNGLKIVIIGKPNVGKSSLFNKILKYERAIISDIPGTTRDYIKEDIVINGVPTYLIDTAGIRKTNNEIEKIGIKKSEKNIIEADIILFLIDNSTNWDENDNILYSLIKKHKNVIFIINKIDLDKKEIPEKIKDPLYISVLKNKNIDKLEEIIRNRLKEIYSNIDTEFIINERQRIILENALIKTKNISNLIDTRELEILSYEFSDIIDIIEEITGKITKEDIIENIFSTFCIGK